MARSPPARAGGFYGTAARCSPGSAKPGHRDVGEACGAGGLPGAGRHPTARSPPARIQLGRRRRPDGDWLSDADQPWVGGGCLGFREPGERARMARSPPARAGGFYEW